MDEWTKSRFVAQLLEDLYEIGQERNPVKIEGLRQTIFSDIENIVNLILKEPRK